MRSVTKGSSAVWARPITGRMNRKTDAIARLNSFVVTLTSPYGFKIGVVLSAPRLLRVGRMDSEGTALFPPSVIQCLI